MLHGTSSTQTAPTDANADILNGGAGADSLFLGAGDTGIGGADADQFILSSDVTGAVTVNDFNVAEDSLVVQALVPADVSVTDQTVTAGDLAGVDEKIRNLEGVYQQFIRTLANIRKNW